MLVLLISTKTFMIGFVNSRLMFSAVALRPLREATGLGYFTNPNESINSALK